MSPARSAFANRSVYNAALSRRYGPPASLADYLLKAQMMDYEATRAQHEAYAARWRAARPATGSVYWMLNGAWPGLHWSLVDAYLHPAGAYFGAKAGCRCEHVVYDPVDHGVWLVNRSLDRRALSAQALTARTRPNAAAHIGGVGLLRLVLRDARGATLSRGIYWLARPVDRLSWANSTWRHTPVSEHADLTALGRMRRAAVALGRACPSAGPSAGRRRGWDARLLVLENRSPTPAFFLRLNLVDGAGADVSPVLWSDNYVTLWPRETLRLRVRYSAAGAAER